MITEIKAKSFNEIKKTAPDTWALIVDPVYSEKNGTLKSGHCLYFHKNKEKVHQYVMKEEPDIFQHYTIVYTGELPKDQIFVL